MSSSTSVSDDSSTSWQLQQLGDSGFVDEVSKLDSSLQLSYVVRQETKCRVKLRLIERGHDPDQVLLSDLYDKQQQQEQQVSQETLQMQQQRRERNKQAAKHCRIRRKKRENELKLKCESLLRKSEKLSQIYSIALQQLVKTQQQFDTYLQLNRHLVHDPDVKPLLQQFKQNHYDSLPLQFYL